MKINIEQHTQSYRHVKIDNPPINIFDQEMADEFSALLTKLETDDAVKIVVFEIFNPNYFIASADNARTDEKREPAETFSLHYLLKRMERSHFLTVGVLRGHACGAGSEFLLGLDVRFASREKAVLSQIDPGIEFSKTTSGFERLCNLVGRARALEIILGSEDLDADMAERLGLINRSIPDKDLSQFVQRFVSNISNFDREYIALVKQVSNNPMDQAMNAFSNEKNSDFFEILKWSKKQEQIATPLECEIHEQGDWELPLGEQLRPDYA